MSVQVNQGLVCQILDNDLSIVEMCNLPEYSSVPIICDVPGRGKFEPCVADPYRDRAEAGLQPLANKQLFTVLFVISFIMNI